MSVPQRVRGAKILKAVSSPLRLQILNLLFDKGSLSYTELMASLKMNASRDAGRFAYHLKFLLKADLIEADVETRKYLLNELGKMVIDVADRIDKKAFKPKSTLVRTSRLALEEFDANKIANSLVREAQMPAELAQKVAKEAEKLLIRSKIKYLTAPLVREVVNATLIEKGLEEYRHKLTRLGIPVHDVAKLVETKSDRRRESSMQERAGETIFKEYALLNIFPRDISDAHLSGALHVNSLSSWILRPSEISHDLRFFFEKGLNLEKIDAFQPTISPPHDIESALALTLNTCLHSAKEVESEQTIDYFNIFLAPFAKDAEPPRIKDALRLFVQSLMQHAQVSLGIELNVPDFLAKQRAYGPEGKRSGIYSDSLEQAQLMANLLFEVLTEEGEHKPFIWPRIIVKIRGETVEDKKAEALLLKAHKLASESGITCFANATQKNRRHSVFSSSGFRLDEDFDGDWETDTLRTGCLGVVTLNTPRIAYETGKDKMKFFETLKERMEMASRALEIKYRSLKGRGGNLLPFLTQGGNGDQYFRLENCSRVINMAGLEAALQIFGEKSITDEETLAFAGEVSENISDYIHKIGRRRRKRLSSATLPSLQASERLARTDMERYGIAKVKFSGSRDKPFYSTVTKLTLNGGRLPQNYSVFESKLVGAHSGGSLTSVDLGEAKYEPPELIETTKLLLQNPTDVFVYERELTYCSNCRKTWFGQLHKCPSCGAVGTLALFDRFKNT